MRILLSNLAPATRAELQAALTREAWVSAVVTGEPFRPAMVEHDDLDPWERSSSAPVIGESLTTQTSSALADLVIVDGATVGTLPPEERASLRAAFPQTQIAALCANAGERQVALESGAEYTIPADNLSEAVATLRLLATGEPGEPLDAREVGA